ncbi:MaoC family dehydratase N-terminal domain-containing protein [Sphingomonas sp. MG17]|uniref:MaoC family dehydratase N-terminal domain-containing protein n=1 Tax=Sphingomonas tagetis TaxID=2949092 RepID=A0A9X2HI23_9SPHN|nr:MaoC/PaaZ C-terminal domain-containing protein [Sphingomonas tagetis]MCP3730307.1 MaoC family dehydratase N-terminal domain-containing protein [Sphingomonas tagetis]
MPLLNADRLLNFDEAPTIEAYTETDTMLYGLSLGYGSDPLDERQLRYVFERDLVAVPTMAHTLAMDASWITDPASGIDLAKMLHAESGLTVHNPLPASGRVSSKLKIPEIIDKGEGRGALLYFARELSDAATGQHLATITSTFFLRGNGGFGGANRSASPPAAIPDRAADFSLPIATLPQSALLYRLTGDDNPLHADPELARKVGFDRPILHGSCTYGVACRALIHLVCGDDPHRLGRIDVRFTAPTYPGEALLTEVWNMGEGQFVFRCRVVERDIVVLNHGVAQLRDA